MSRPTITIPHHSDPKLGYLSTSSRHPFLLDEKIYPTVEHYILSKMFEGTMLEERIRMAKSVGMARAMVKPRHYIFEVDGRVVRRTVYGDDKSSRVRDDWGVQRTLAMRAALFAKFEQNPRLMGRLLSTEGATIVDPVNPYIGEITTELRDAKIAMMRTPTIITASPRISHPAADITGGPLTGVERKFLRSTVDLLEKIRVCEGVDRIYVEMLEDAVINLFNVDISTLREVPDLIGTWVKDISEHWSSTIKTMPKFEGIVREVETLLQTTTLDPNDILSAAVTMSAVIRWMRMDDVHVDGISDLKELLTQHAKKIKISQITLKPTTRPYRVGPPKMVVRQHIPGEEFRMEISSLMIKMVYGARQIEVRGRGVSHLTTKLLVVGGKVHNDHLITISIARASMLEEILLGLAGVLERELLSYRFWIRRQIGYMVDLSRRIQKVHRRYADIDAMRVVVEKICGSSMVPPTISENDPDKPRRMVVKETCRELGLSKKVSIYLSKASILSKESPRNLTTIDKAILTSAITKILAVAPSKKMDLAERTLWSFLTVCPKSMRSSAERYVRSAMDDANDVSDPARVELIRANGLDEKVGCAAISFAITRGRIGNYLVDGWLAMLEMVCGVGETSPQPIEEVATSSSHTVSDPTPKVETPLGVPMVSVEKVEKEKKEGEISDGYVEATTEALSIETTHHDQNLSKPKNNPAKVVQPDPPSRSMRKNAKKEKK